MNIFGKVSFVSSFFNYFKSAYDEDGQFKSNQWPLRFVSNKHVCSLRTLNVEVVY